MSGSKHDQLRYLAQSVRLEERRTPHLVLATMCCISGFVILFLIWAALTRVDEIARAPGDIVPRGLQKLVQHLEGGIVSEILVQEGALVEQGQPLIRLQDAGATGDLQRAKLRQMTLEFQKIRLEAFINGTQPDYSAYGNDYKDLVAEQLATFRSMMESKAKERLVIIDQIEQKKNALSILKNQQETSERNKAIFEDLYQKRKKLVEEGALPSIRAIETQQRLNDLTGEGANIRHQLTLAGEGLAEFQSRLKSLDAKHREDAYQKMDDVKAEIAQTEELLEKLTERVKRLEITAPARGFVKGLVVNTIGGVVQPAQTLMELVPLDKSLVAQLRVQPADIGSVKVGMPVRLKFSAYDFTKNGAVDGSIESLSATTFINERGEPYFKAIIVFDAKQVGKNPENLILPGMTVIADIVTGDKTILQYLFKPINASLDTAFTEE